MPTTEISKPFRQDHLMTVQQAAQYLGLAVSTLNKWRCHGGGRQLYRQLGTPIYIRFLARYFMPNQFSRFC